MIMTTRIEKPKPGEYAPYYQPYIDKVQDPDPLHLMKSQIMDLQALLSEIPAEKEEFAYAKNKWTIKQLIGHIIDAERIFTYRALRIARGDQTPLHGFEENDYAASGRFNERSLPDLGHEYAVVRESTVALFKSFDAETLLRTGMANNNTVSVRAILYIIAGHQLHHEQVLRERYLPEIE
ncbi:MAG: hypothetical protein FD123_4045 [Bacteroidetes bacterium]|nr:MAG: hypothetical protein FD123_4045 [Bacteroidota bacterium]